MGTQRAAEAQADVCVVGMGYVGLSLAITLASVGIRVLGYDKSPSVYGSLVEGQPHIYEAGASEGLRRYLNKSLWVTSELPAELPAVTVVCVGTPFNSSTNVPDLSQLEAAVTAVAERITDASLVIVRSTVPVGTSRNIVLPILKRTVSNPLLAFCPERTIQGKALEELRLLPQVVSGLDTVARQRAADLFERIAPEVVNVSSLEAAEAIKLICIAHTDLIYGFGNEVALIAASAGLDADELIQAANQNYPRPDLSRPGFVGGPCISKDPYLLAHSLQAHGYVPSMVMAARKLNESIPTAVCQRLLASLHTLGYDPADATVLVSGFAYKGHPETDDVRGSPVIPVLACLSPVVKQIRGHDFVVPADGIAQFGVEPVDLERGFADAHAALILNNHVNYPAQPIRQLTATMATPALLFDVWGVFRDWVPFEHGVQYRSLAWMSGS